MIARSELLKNAIDHTQKLALEKSAHGDNRSVFGVLRSLVAISSTKAEGEQLETCRMILEKADGLSTEYFRSVKLDELKKLIHFLFEDDGAFLSPKCFGGYSANDLLGYLEICRRRFITQAKPVTQDSPQDARDDIEKRVSTEEKAPADERWGLSSIKLMRTKWDLKAGNKDCARYVIEHQDKCSDKEAIKQAKRILQNDK
jgi:hypothetical protein